MELTLNIYENGKVKKTYAAEDYFLSTGVCEDILEIAEGSDLLTMFVSGNANDLKMGLEVIKTVSRLAPKLKPIFKEVFIGVTDEELRQTDIKEYVACVKNIVSFVVNELFGIEGKKK